MRRREFITLICGTTATWPLVVRADVATKRPLIAALSAITKESNAPLNAFVQGLKELGYVDGVNVDLVYRFAEGHLDRFPVLAAEVVGLKPDVGDESADQINSDCLPVARQRHQPRLNCQ